MVWEVNIIGAELRLTIWYDTGPPRKRRQGEGGGTHLGLPEHGPPVLRGLGGRGLGQDKPPGDGGRADHPGEMVTRWSKAGGGNYAVGGDEKE